jgi:hypothetical protein
MPFRSRRLPGILPIRSPLESARTDFEAVSHHHHRVYVHGCLQRFHGSFDLSGYAGEVYISRRVGELCFVPRHGMEFAHGCFHGRSGASAAYLLRGAKKSDWRDRESGDQEEPTAMGSIDWSGNHGDGLNRLEGTACLRPKAVCILPEAPSRTIGWRAAGAHGLPAISIRCIALSR